ncbi:MAG: hypothetical protein L3J23_01380 [Flavobacteriaceae bacterium]|nr:hypothetical protein [Flavobacteriaceae bacterium]
MYEIKLKKLGKKKIKTIYFNVRNKVDTLSELLTECVRSEVERFNSEKETPTLLPFLSPKEIQQQSETGKISFGDNFNATKVAVEKAIENILLAFKDGLFVVFIDDNEIKSLKQQTDISTESSITFIRLTFLTGTYW